jgi:hypothetical protein
VNFTHGRRVVLKISAPHQLGENLNRVYSGPTAPAGRAAHSAVAWALRLAVPRRGRLTPAAAEIPSRWKSERRYAGQWSRPGLLGH